MQTIIYFLCSLIFASEVTSLTPITEGPEPTSAPSNSSAINVTCGQNEMSISIPKILLPRIDREHIRLSNLSCTAIETRDNYILSTRLTECLTKIRHTRHFVAYSNKVEEIPTGPNQIITRVREVEIPFSCYYSNTGVVSAVGIRVEARKIVFSRRGFGKFVLEMKIFPTDQFQNAFRKSAFPVVVSLRQYLYVEVSVASDDHRLSILAERCFATPDPDPTRRGVKYVFIDHGCSVDEDDTLTFIDVDDPRRERFSLEAFSFVGDHPFVYMHCKVRICNATDNSSRCAQGCIPPQSRVRRSLIAASKSKDEEVFLAEGPFMREDEDKTTVDETTKDIKDEEANGMQSTLVTTMAVMAVVCLVGASYLALQKRKNRALRQYQQLTVPSDD